MSYAYILSKNDVFIPYLMRALMNRKKIFKKYKSLNNESKKIFLSVFNLDSKILEPIAIKVGLNPEDILIALNSELTLVDLIYKKEEKFHT